MRPCLRRQQTTRKMYPLPFLEARSHLQGHVPSQIPEQNSALPLPAPGVSERVGGGSYKLEY